jgi:hypothetical protein
MYWVYDLPNWLFGVLTILVFCAFGVGGVVATRRWVPSLHHAEHHPDHSHNDIVGFYFGGVTVLYGITLGLLMVGVWSNFTEAASKADGEAGTLDTLYRFSSAYPEPTRSQLQNELRRYARNVIDVAWPLQKKGIVSIANKPVLDDVGRELAAFEPVSEGQKVLHAETCHLFNELIQRRRDRHVFTKAGLSASLWALVLIGAVINIAVTWCFHVKNKKMHIWMTAVLSSLLGLMIFLLAAMDHPFMGELSVSSESFQLVYDRLMKPDLMKPPNASEVSGTARTR